MNNHETRRQHDRYLLNMLTSVSILFADTTRPRTSQKCYINHCIVGCVLTGLYFFTLWKKNVCSGLHKSIYIFKKYHTLGTFSTSHKETQLILLAYKYMTLAVLSCYNKKKWWFLLTEQVLLSFVKKISNLSNWQVNKN